MSRIVCAITILSVSCLTSSSFAQDPENLQLLPPVEVQEEPEPELEVTAPETITPIYPAWAKPIYEFIGPLWEGSTELGINGAQGDQDTFSMRVGGNLKRESESNTLDIQMTYGQNQSNGVENQNNGLLSTRWDWNLGPAWILYDRFQMEYDEFKSFDLRLSFALGLGYHFIKHDAASLTGRLGAAASHEMGGPDDVWVPEVDFGTDFSHELSNRQSIKGSVDFYPAWEDFNDYRLVSQVHWVVLLDEATNLSLKLGLIDRYDSTPNGQRPNAFDYYLTLLWKI